MSIDFEPTGTIANRIARSLPGASFELETLVRLVGIVESTGTPTASVSCTSRPRLTINPEFVAEYCARDEHLFLLVMHEMWHVLLGHTTLYQRPTLLHNIAFDALINAGLARQFPSAPYRGFFERLNPADQFPGLLLRPPVGWPENPSYNVPGPRGTGKLLARLYPPPTAHSVQEPLYEEILDLLLRAKMKDDTKPQLLGSHVEVPPGSGNFVERDLLEDSNFSDVVRKVVGSWPPPPVILRGRNTGGSVREQVFGREIATETARAKVREVLEKAARPTRAGARIEESEMVRQNVGPGPLPNFADRTAPAKRLLQPGIVLPQQRLDVRQRRPDPPAQAIVYFDVSGSMRRLLPKLLDLLIAPARQGLVSLRQFSTVVEPLQPAAVLEGRVQTTWGTEISCVLEDILRSTANHVVIISDGYVGVPEDVHVQSLRARDIKVDSLIPQGAWTRDLAVLGEIHFIPGLEEYDG